MRRRRMGEFIFDDDKDSLFTFYLIKSDETQSDVSEVKEVSNEVDEIDSTKEEQKIESNGTSSTCVDEEKCDNKDATAIDVLSSNAVIEQHQQNNKNGKSNNNN